MVTRKEVARRARVSVGTVSNVINHKDIVQPKTVERVRQAIRELNYVPDQIAKSLAQRRTNHIGVAIYEMTNPYHAEVVRGLESYAAKKGYIVSTFFLNNNAEKKMDEICERRLAGLVNFMTNDLPHSFINILKSHKVVLANFNEDESFIFQHDYSAAMKTYFEALKQLGKRNIAYISTADRLRFLADTRGVAYYRYVSEFGMAEDDALVVFNDRYDLPSQTIGYLGCQRLLESGARPDAIFVTNDIAAMGVLRRLCDNGIRCPEDVAVIGCDDIALGKVFIPAISTITVNSVAYGEAIAETMIARIENPEANPYKKVVLEAQPCFRESLCADALPLSFKCK